jgi:hypothetical protein
MAHLRIRDSAAVRLGRVQLFAQDGLRSGAFGHDASANANANDCTALVGRSGRR